MREAQHNKLKVFVEDTEDEGSKLIQKYVSPIHMASHP
jgi:hypothetical protein